MEGKVAQAVQVAAVAAVAVMAAVAAAVLFPYLYGIREPEQEQ
jgi:hypothetical protein